MSSEVSRLHKVTALLVTGSYFGLVGRFLIGRCCQGFDCVFFRRLFLQELCSFAHTAESQVMPDGAVHLTQIGAAQLPAWGTTTYTQEHMRQHIQATMTTGNHEHKVVHVFSTDPAMSWFHLHATFPPVCLLCAVVCVYGV